MRRTPVAARGDRLPRHRLPCARASLTNASVRTARRERAAWQERVVAELMPAGDDSDLLPESLAKAGWRVVSSAKGPSRGCAVRGLQAARRPRPAMHFRSATRSTSFSRGRHGRDWERDLPAVTGWSRRPRRSASPRRDRGDVRARCAGDDVRAASESSATATARRRSMRRACDDERAASKDQEAQVATGAAESESTNAVWRWPDRLDLSPGATKRATCACAGCGAGCRRRSSDVAIVGDQVRDVTSEASPYDDWLPLSVVTLAGGRTDRTHSRRWCTSSRRFPRRRR